MSMISELVNKLRFYEAGCKGAEFKKVLGEAANTIEEQGAKLQQLNMERSSQYYNNGWIPCSDGLPEKAGFYVVTKRQKSGEIQVALGSYRPLFNEWSGNGNFKEVLAWIPLPEPYNPDAPNTNNGHKTNADKIRSMSDEELAELITSGEWSCICPMCLYYETDICCFENGEVERNCVQGIMDWLKAESEG